MPGPAGRGLEARAPAGGRALGPEGRRTGAAALHPSSLRPGRFALFPVPRGLSDRCPQRARPCRGGGQQEAAQGLLPLGTALCQVNRWRVLSLARVVCVATDAGLGTDWGGGV